MDGFDFGLGSEWDSPNYSNIYNDTQYRNPYDSMSFLDLFTRMRNQSQPTSPSTYYDPKDPEVQTYLSSAFAKPESENLLSTYMNEAPRKEDYKPGIWRTLGSALLGMASAYGGGNPNLVRQNTESMYYGPYQDKLEDWKREGSLINTRARMMDAAKNRGLAAMKYNLDQKYKSRVAASREDQAGIRSDTSIAGLAATDADRDAARKIAEDRAREVKAVNEQKKKNEEERLKNETERLGLARERLEFEKTRPRGTQPVKDISDYAREAKANADLLERAKNDAVSHPIFKQYFTQVQDKVTGDLKWTFTGPPEIRKIIDDFVRARLKNYSVGLQPDLTEE